ncbi:MAG: nitrate reductase molybdenum cofactor assembly chaperone [Coriobacteriales bacterium]
MIWELKALACLLLYPDEDLLTNLPEIESTLQGSEELDGESKRRLEELIGWIREADMSSLQAAYVSTFDIGKHGSLNLFEHTQGDSRDRGHVMVELNRLYKEHGLELTTTELPDHLPVFLEFLSGLEREDAQLWLESVIGPIEKIDRELQLDESPWEAVTAALLNFAGTEREVASERTPDEMIPTLDAEYYESPVTFGGSIDPVTSH